MQYLEAMKAILPLVLLFLSTTLLAQNIPSIEQVEAELEELKKKDDLRAYTLEFARQRDSLIEVFDRQVLNLEQELSSTAFSLHKLEFDFDNAMTSIEALNQNKEMLENKINYLQTVNSTLNDSISTMHSIIHRIDRIEKQYYTDSLIMELENELWNGEFTSFTEPYIIGNIDSSMTSGLIRALLSEKACIDCYWYEMDGYDVMFNKLKFIHLLDDAIYFILNEKHIILPLKSRTQGKLVFEKHDLRVVSNICSECYNLGSSGSETLFYKGKVLLHLDGETRHTF